MSPDAPEIETTGRRNGLEDRITDVGRRLAASVTAVLDGVAPGAPHRPQALAQTLGLDKVLTSRTLKVLSDSTDAPERLKGIPADPVHDEATLRANFPKLPAKADGTPQ